jgi:multisubunit Na+/H+ antiporter MnhE subunit
MRRGFERARAWLLAWVALFWLWMLLVGEWNRDELVAAALAATVAATVGVAAWTAGGLRFRIPVRWVSRAALLPARVALDFGIVMWVLLRSLVLRRRVHGRFRARDFAAGGDDPASFGIRAWATLLTTLGPNTYVVDIDAERDTALLHELADHPGPGRLV